MPAYSFAHLSDSVLLRDYASHRGRRHRDTAIELAYLGEIEARQLYRPAGHESMHTWCVETLHFSEDSAYKHVRAAKMARRYPALLDAVAEGKLHLSAIVLLAAQLTTENVSELIAAATHRSKAQIELMLAARFPKPDLPERIEVANSWPVAREELHDRLAPGPNVAPTPNRDAAPASATFELPVSPPVAPPIPAARVKPLSPQRFGYQFTADQSFHDDLERFRSLMGNRAGASELVETLHQALRLGIRELEKRKHGLTDRPHVHTSRVSKNPRHVPSAVKRAVWKRDGGRCTFASENGRRCEARARLEFDHIEPVGRGGTATIGNLRLRCRAHNQYEAERVYGAEFMKHKREGARQAATDRGNAEVTGIPRAAT